MYRALALKALRAGCHCDDERALAGLRTTRIELEDDGRVVRLDGEDVSTEIRTRR